MEERGVGNRGLLYGGGIVRHSGHAFGYEKNAEQVPSVLDEVGYTSRIEGCFHFSPQLPRCAVDLLIDLLSRQPQRRETGRRGPRAPARCRRRLDSANRRQILHEVGAAAERRRRETAAHHLAEGHQVWPYPIEAELS